MNEAIILIPAAVVLLATLAGAGLVAAIHNRRFSKWLSEPQNSLNLCAAITVPLFIGLTILAMAA